MKIAISATGNKLVDDIDLRFGRAGGFIIYDLKSDKYKFINNTQNLNAIQGAGIQTAQNVINQDVEVLITGHCGPKAFKVLNENEIKVYIGESGSVKEVIEKFKEKKLIEATSADVEGHW